jgi:hypothetical protein
VVAPEPASPRGRPESDCEIFFLGDDLRQRKSIDPNHLPKLQPVRCWAALGCSSCHLDNWDANFGASTDAGYVCDPMTAGGVAACAP